MKWTEERDGDYITIRMDNGSIAGAPADVWDGLSDAQKEGALNLAKDNTLAKIRELAGQEE